MRLARIYGILLIILMLFGGLCLLIGCSADETIQSAQLVEASTYYYLQRLNTKPLPLNGRGIISLDDTIELVFDKPVRQVSINTIDARPNQVPTATVWLLQTKRLKVWDREIGWNPEKDATLTINYEDETGVHKYTLKVTLGAYSVDVFPLEIVSVNVANNQIDADANRLNQQGIRITFSEEMEISRTQIEVYRGRVMLNWKIDWIEDDHTAILLPEGEGDWLLPGHEYQVHVIDFYNFAGRRGKGLEDGPIVIRFQTAN